MSEMAQALVVEDLSFTAPGSFYGALFACATEHGGTVQLNEEYFRSNLSSSGQQLLSNFVWPNRSHAVE